VLTVVTAVTVLTVAFNTDHRDSKVKVERGKVVAMDAVKSHRWGGGEIDDSTHS
jgi:hypothetical protein